jgi:hypothetical protein
MTSEMTAFMVAVGATSLVCYLLMNRVQDCKARRESAGGDASGMAPGAPVPAAIAGTCLPGSAATVPRRIIPAHPAISAATVEEGVVTAAVAATDAKNSGKISAGVIWRNDAFLDSFQYSPRHQFGIA